jgi:hypothetical protein
MFVWIGQTDDESSDLSVRQDPLGAEIYNMSMAQSQVPHTAQVKNDDVFLC